ncbi:hypothetical protein [Streptomyces sp. NPDC012888]|uniref:hypothetical protein n=1 Tax=Streptomyces sp. NPDC012888 TaxID=3364855 RepID=UPI0036C94FE0
MALLFGSLTVVFAMASVIHIAWAALIVTALWAAVGAALSPSGAVGSAAELPTAPGAAALRTG